MAALTPPTVEIDVVSYENKGEVQSMRLAPGDVVVISFNDYLNEKQIARIRAEMLNMFPDNRCLVLEKDVRVAVINRVEDHHDRS